MKHETYKLQVPKGEMALTIRAVKDGKISYFIDHQVIYHPQQIRKIFEKSNDYEVNDLPDSAYLQLTKGKTLL